MRTMRNMVLLSLVFVLAVPVAVYAAGAPETTGPVRETAGPADAGSGASGGTAEADRTQTRDQLQDGTCDTADVSAEDAFASEPAQTRTRTTEAAQTQSRTMSQTQSRTRTMAQDGSCDASATCDGEPDRDQLRDRDQLKDGSCDDSSTVTPTDTVVASSVALDSGDQLRDRVSLLDRIVESVPAGVAEWFRSMLRVFGLAA